MDQTIIQSEDLLDPSHWPVQAAIGLYEGGASDLPQIATNAAAGEGTYMDDCCISFWEDLDEYEKNQEEPFEVSCDVVNDSCSLSYAEFGHYLEIACSRYALRHPETADQFEKALNAYRKTFLQRTRD